MPASELVSPVVRPSAVQCLTCVVARQPARLTCEVPRTACSRGTAQLGARTRLDLGGPCASCLVLSHGTPRIEVAPLTDMKLGKVTR